ncbi:hypothetical protein RCH14_003070 [Massilia sp. MP_M2]|uniref:hypothetical protein n=1 Tax=Massilia sp. MP_M2 TaxID=3071713 RepID=UPI00319DBD23
MSMLVAGERSVMQSMPAAVTTRVRRAPSPRHGQSGWLAQVRVHACARRAR